MEIGTSTIITWIGTGIGLLGVWFRNQFKIERLEEINVELMRQKDALWKWINEHEKDAGDLREKVNREISEIRGSLLVTNEQFKQILEALKDIKERISELEKG